MNDTEPTRLRVFIWGMMAGTFIGVILGKVAEAYSG